MTDVKYAPAPAEPPPSYETAAKPPPPPPSRLPFPLDLPLINSLRDRRVILASASPRRKQLLAQVVNLPPVLGLELMCLDWSHQARNQTLHFTRKPPKIARAFRVCSPDGHPKGHACLLVRTEQYGARGASRRYVIYESMFSLWDKFSSLVICLGELSLSKHLSRLYFIPQIGNTDSEISIQSSPQIQSLSHYRAKSWRSLDPRPIT